MLTSPIEHQWRTRILSPWNPGRMVGLGFGKERHCKNIINHQEIGESEAMEYQTNLAIWNCEHLLQRRFASHRGSPRAKRIGQSWRLWRRGRGNRPSYYRTLIMTPNHWMKERSDTRAFIFSSLFFLHVQTWFFENLFHLHVLVRSLFLLFLKS